MRVCTGAFGVENWAHNWILRSHRELVRVSDGVRRACTLDEVLQVLNSQIRARMQGLLLTNRVAKVFAARCCDHETESVRSTIIGTIGDFYIDSMAFSGTTSIGSCLFGRCQLDLDKAI